MSPRAQALGHPQTFCSHLKTRFKQKFRPKYMLKKCVFFERKKERKKNL